MFLMDAYGTPFKSNARAIARKIARAFPELGKQFRNCASNLARSFWMVHTILKLRMQVSNFVGNSYIAPAFAPATAPAIAPAVYKLRLHLGPHSWNCARNCARNCAQNCACNCGLAKLGMAKHGFCTCYLISQYLFTVLLAFVYVWLYRCFWRMYTERHSNWMRPHFRNWVSNSEIAPAIWRAVFELLPQLRPQLRPKIT